MSGLSHTPGKRTWGYTHRGFESRLFRQTDNRYAPSKALFYFYPRLNPRRFYAPGNFIEALQQ